MALTYPYRPELVEIDPFADHDPGSREARACGPDDAVVRTSGRLTCDLREGDALDLIADLETTPDLIATDPPYAFGGSGAEHALSATVAVVLRESAKRLARGRWMLVMCASSWRSQAYMVEAVRGLVEPVRVGTWCKPVAKSKTRTTGWAWASVSVIAFRKGKAADATPSELLDHIVHAPLTQGRRAQVPDAVADWMIRPFSVPGGHLFDPFGGSGALLRAGNRAGMHAIGFEKHPTQEAR